MMIRSDHVIARFGLEEPIIPYLLTSADWPFYQPLDGTFKKLHKLCLGPSTLNVQLKMERSCCCGIRRSVGESKMFVHEVDAEPAAR